MAIGSHPTTSKLPPLRRQVSSKLHEEKQTIPDHTIPELTFGWFRRGTSPTKPMGG